MTDTRRCSKWARGLRQIRALSISASLVLFVVDRGASAAVDQGAELAAACAPCHRLDGRDAGIPSIVGLDAATLTQAMRDFRSGQRPSQIMHVMSLSLSEDEIATVARYLATLPKETGRP